MLKFYEIGTFLWLILVLNLSNTVFSLDVDNSPPTLRIEKRDIEIEESSPVNSFIFKADAYDNEDDRLVFGIETFDPNKPVPFRIDTETGAVYLAENLTGKIGEKFHFYVTVFDGSIPAKLEMHATVVDKLSPNPRPPHFRPPFTPHLPYINSPYQILQNNHFNRPENVTERTASNPNQLKPNYTEKENAKEEEISIKNDEISPNIEVKSLITVLGIFGVFIGIIVVLGVLKRKIWFHTSQKVQKTDEKITKRDEISSPPLVINPDYHYSRSSNESQVQKRDQLTSKESSELTESIKTRDFWEFERHKLVFLGVLGEGAFGQVWKCQVNDSNDKVHAKGDSKTSKIVAVKTLKENSTERDKLDLLSELKVMKMLKQHPNVVRLLGCCTEKDPIFVIMEFVSGGKLQSFLRLQRIERVNFEYDNIFKGSKKLTSGDLTRMVHQVAKGMEFLELNGIIHRDLAARNVLITEDHTCKVADFGFARDVISTYVYERKSEGRLPIRWMAPESLYDNLFSSKSDVWSFGVLIWEVVTLGSTPYPGMSAQEVMKKVRDGYRLDKPEHCRRELYNIMYYCWHEDPKERPTFTECLELLDNLLTTETDYIELERFPDHSYYNVLNISGEKL